MQDGCNLAEYTEALTRVRPHLPEPARVRRYNGGDSVYNQD